MQALTAPWLHETNELANTSFSHTNLRETETDFMRNVTCDQTRHKLYGRARPILAGMRPIGAPAQATTVAHVVEYLLLQSRRVAS